MNYMPSSTAGCLISIGTILLMLGIVGTGELAGRYLESGIPSVIAWIAALGCFIAFMRFAKRHS